MSEFYFATNRGVKFETSKNAANFTDKFDPLGPQLFRVGKVSVRLVGDPLRDSGWKVGRTVLYSEDLNSLQPGGPKLGSAGMFEDLRAALKKTEKDILIYVHGYANSFENTARRMAALQHLYKEYGKNLIVLAFSWPSNGQVSPSYHYRSDREDAAASGLAMARSLKRLVEFLTDIRAEDKRKLLKASVKGNNVNTESLRQCNRRIHLIAHSMGVYALRNALLSFAELNKGHVPRIINHAFLMAADEDSDALSRGDKLALLPKLADFVHIYHSYDDDALMLSDVTKGNSARLGVHGPDHLEALGPRVFLLDCQDVSHTKFIEGRHQYYRLRKEVLSDVAATMLSIPHEGRNNRLTIKPGVSWRIIPEKTPGAV